MVGTGDLLGDRYRLDEFLASGGMGQVWRATDTVLGRTVAVKLLLPALLHDPDFEVRFRAEARIMAALRHPGVADVYDYGQSEPGDGPRTLYLVMAYVDGEPLSDRITRLGRLSPEQTLAVVAGAAEALHAAHLAGIVHRDVKPGNLLIRDDGQVTLVDFGVARSSAVTSVTTDQSVRGTALYMAPEQASGRDVTAATDVYALGAVAYHCLVGAPPFAGHTPLEIALRHLQDDPPALPDEVPAPARALVERAMSKDPRQRYPSAAALAVAARAAGNGAGTDDDPHDSTVDSVTAAAAAAGAAGAAGAAATRFDLMPVGTPADSPTGEPLQPVPGPYRGPGEGLDPDGAANTRRNRRRLAALGGLLALTLGGAVLIAVLNLGGEPGDATPGPVPGSVGPSVVPGSSAPAGGQPGRSGQPSTRTSPTGGTSAVPSEGPQAPAPTGPPGTTGPAPTTPAPEPTGPTEPTDPPPTDPPGDPTVPPGGASAPANP